MRDDAAAKRKKKYEAPLMAGPESDGKRGRSFSPAGVTGCAYGAFGAECSHGTDPQGTPASCNAGGEPEVQNCDNGTNAGVACIHGEDAVQSCNTGTRVQGDCLSGTTPLGALCDNGHSAATCSNGSSV
jgi:hypothetical protein